jgi:hypothetical protein
MGGIWERGSVAVVSDLSTFSRQGTNLSLASWSHTSMDTSRGTLPLQERRLNKREAASIIAGLHSNIIDTSLAAVAGVVSAAIGSKKRGVCNHDNNHEDGGTNNKEDSAKRSKKNPAISPPFKSKLRKDPPMDATGLVFAQPVLKPAPYFYYSDHSLEKDDNPLMPITAMGSVPTFPASEFPFHVYFAFFIFILSFVAAGRLSLAKNIACCVPTYPPPARDKYPTVLSYCAEMHAILTNPALADVVGWAPNSRLWRILTPRDFKVHILPKYFEHSKFWVP